MSNYAGISEEACAFRLLIKFGHREAIRQFINMPGLKKWPAESVLMCMHVLLCHGALLVEDPKDADNTLEWASNRFAACQGQGEDTIHQQLIELIEKHSSTSTSTSRPTSHWGTSPASDVRALMHHVLRYGRDQQRRVLSYHPHCATAALAAASGMGPQMRDVVHWMLAIAAHVDGLDLRQLRRKRLRRRVGKPAAEAPATATNTLHFSDQCAEPTPGQIHSAFSSAAREGWPSTSSNRFSSEIHANGEPDSHTSCSGCGNGTDTSAVSCNGHVRTWAARAAGGGAQPSSDTHSQQAAKSHPHHRHHPFSTIGSDEELKKVVIAEAQTKGVESHATTNGTHAAPNAEALVFPCNGSGSAYPQINGGAVDGNADMRAYLECVGKTEAQPGVSSVLNGHPCNDMSSTCGCNRHSSMAEDGDSVFWPADTNVDQQHQQPQSKPVVGGVFHAHQSHGNAMNVEPAVQGHEQTDLLACSNPFTVMQQQLIQQHMQVVVSVDNCGADLHLLGPQTPSLHEITHSNQHTDGHAAVHISSMAGCEEADGRGGDGPSWLDFLTDPGLIEGMQQGVEVEEELEGSEDGDSMEREQDEEGEVERWVLSPLAEAAAAGDRYVVELLLEVHGATPDAHGALAERVARAHGNANIAKIIYEKTLALAAARGGHMAALADSPGAAGEGADGEAETFQYVSLGDWVASMMPSWDRIWGGGKGGPVVYRSRSGARYKQPLRYLRLGLALAGTATVGYLAYSCIKSLTQPRQGSGTGGGLEGGAQKVSGAAPGIPAVVTAAK